MKETLNLRVLSFLLLCVCTSQAQISSLRCSRDPPQDQSESPEYLCDVDVTVVRNTDCSVTITEQYLFPYTTGRDAFRSIPLIQGQQVARNVVAKRNNDTVFMASRLESSCRNENRVNIPTQQQNQPVLIMVQYILEAGVTQFTTTCFETGAVPPVNETVNVIRWRTGFWEQTFDRMRVSFSTTNRNATFSVASARDGQVNASSTENSIIISWEEVSTEDRSIDVLVMERGIELCTEELRCFSEWFSNILEF